MLADGQKMTTQLSYAPLPQTWWRKSKQRSSRSTNGDRLSCGRIETRLSRRYVSTEHPKYDATVVRTVSEAGPEKESSQNRAGMLLEGKPPQKVEKPFNPLSIKQVVPRQRLTRDHFSVLRQVIAERGEDHAVEAFGSKCSGGGRAAGRGSGGSGPGLASHIGVLRAEPEPALGPAVEGVPEAYRSLDHCARVTGAMRESRRTEAGIYDRRQFGSSRSC
jgi:hypothetical protein